MLNIPYVSLHNHTTFSIGDSLLTPNALFEKTKALGQAAVAITDHGSLAGAWDGLKAAKKTGVKLIIGCEIYHVENTENEEAPLYHLVLLAKNGNGYKNLLKINKLGFDNYKVVFGRSISRVDWKILEENKDDLICISACGNSIIGQAIMANDLAKAKECASRLKTIFGYDNFALELQPHNLQRRETLHGGPVNQQKINRTLKQIADELNIRCVVATDAHYLNKEDWEDHDVLLANSSKQPIYSGARLKYDKNDFYVKNSLEVASYFTRHWKYWTPEFIQSLFENTVFFADQCEFPDWIDPAHVTGDKYQLPTFPIEDEPDYNEFLGWKKTYDCGSLKDDALFYRYRCYKGLEEKITEGSIPEEDREWCERQLLEEFDVFEYRDFSSYMLIDADFLNWCVDNDIAISPGRGSVGGSLSAYLVGIHKAYPKKYGLIFARFLNKYKDAMPDIDQDIAPTHRDKLHQYLKNKYGHEMIAHVSNVNTITPKVYARDIARVFELGDEGRKHAVELGNNIADSIPAEIKTAKSALEKAPLFAEFAKMYPQLARFADTIGGKPRAWSTHAGGIVISKCPLYEIVPLRRDNHGAAVLEYDKERAEDNGLVKIDTLGLETLDIISKTKEIVKSLGKKIYSKFDYEQADEKTYELISRGDTFGVFQLGGTAVHVCKEVEPKNIDDIALISALVRPAAKDIIKDLIKVRNGDEPINLLHPALERAFSKTYGFGLFEESLLYLAEDIANWGLHEADRLRKLTKLKGKYPEKVEQWKNEFIEGAVKNKGFDKEVAEKIWEECVSAFGGYGFNKSHAVLYSMLSFETAYLKAHYPLEFLTANLMSEVNSNAKASKDNILRIKKEIRDNGIKIVPPDLNKSDRTYKIIDDKTLMTGLDALKFMGADAIPELLEKRPFKSFKDLMYRVDSKKVRSPSVQALAACGALDIFEDVNRQQAFYYASDYRNKLRVHMKKLDSAYNKACKKAEKNGESLPPPPTEVDKEKHLETFTYPFPKDKKWTIREKFALEKEYAGEGISGSVFERYDNFLRSSVTRFDELPKLMPFRDLEDVDERTLRKANTHNIQKYNIRGLKGIITSIWSFIVKKENSSIFGQEMARLTVEDPYGNILDIIAFPSAWEEMNNRLRKLTSGKLKLEPGVAIYFNGMFQWENGSTYSFILGDILSFKEAPALPSDLKSRKIKLPRANSVTLEDLKELSKEELAEKIEEEDIESGIYFEDDDEFEDGYDPFS